MAVVTNNDAKRTNSLMVEDITDDRRAAMSEDFTHWWKQPGLRQLYLLMPFLFLGSTTLGFDGSLLNGLQAMPSWKDCEDFEPCNTSMIADIV